MNYRLVAIEIGDLLKYDTSVNQINRIGQAIFRFQKENFPNDSITSVRARTIHDWILSLAKQNMESEKRNELLVSFCRQICPEQFLSVVESVLEKAGINSTAVNREALAEFMGQVFHPEIIKHCKTLYLQSHYFHAVFEACKVYNKQVQLKAQSQKDGQSLMLEVWSADNGVLKITPCQTETDKNTQNGVKFLSAGLMQAIRNPTAHEPAIDWPVSKQDCLDLLGFLSFLFRQLDKAVYFKA
ncbi:MAG: TIGR02391 family protein [Methylobacter sp.]|nr:TIGR02391 family protein [Methylobacter sp.]